MRTLLWIPLLLSCHKPPSSFGDESLVDVAVEVESEAPLQVLSNAAESLDPTPRARALGWLIRAGDLEEWGPRATFDPSPWVQHSAIDSLAERGVAGHAHLHAMVEQQGAEPSVRSAAALSLPLSARMPQLDEAWRATAEPWNRAPLALAAFAHGDADAAAALNAAVATGELHLDIRFVQALAAHGGPGIGDALKEAQATAEDELHVAIAAARLQLGDPRGEQPLRQALGGSSVDQLEVLDAIAALDSDAVVPLLRKARSGTADLVRWYAELLMAARLGTDTQCFEEALAEEDREVRLLAVDTALLAVTNSTASRKASKDARKALLLALHDEDGPVRAAAARAAGELRSTEATPQLQVLLGDESSMVRIEAAGALLMMGLSPP